MIWRLIAAAALFCTSAASAASADLRDDYCHAVTSMNAAAPPATASFDCAGDPRDYQAARLWLRASLPEAGLSEAGQTLLVHQSRFESLAVAFHYGDGHVERQAVRRGDFGLAWRIGGQIAFTAPSREAPLTGIMLAADRLESYPHFRSRLLLNQQAVRQMSLMAAIVGAALALLALSAVYNALLAFASRQNFIGWHAAWVVTVLFWGLLWSQLALLAVPDIAGTLASKLCTLLATMAISFATACAVTSVEPGRLPGWARHSVLACGTLIGLIGIVAAFPPVGLLPLLGSLLGFLILLDVAAVSALLFWSWRNGDKGARSFALSWALPMAVLASTEVVDYGPSLLGGGSQLAVLLASAFQTVWLSLAETMRLARLRAERDAANAARWEMQQLAECDSLTSLLNRRGFMARAQKALKTQQASFALLLIDIDHFKVVNDRFGHDVGDSVLRCVARCIEENAGPSAFTGRLGGEEFGIGIAGPGRNPIKVATIVREAVEALPLRHLFGEERGVTVSVGVNRATAGSEFETIYRQADRALYAAKNAGRNQVALFDGSQEAGGSRRTALGAAA